MDFIENRSGRYRTRYGDPLGRQRSETFTRRQKPRGSCARSRSRWSAVGGSIRAAPRPHSPRGRRSSCHWPGGCRPRHRRPTAGTSSATSCPRFGSYRLGRLPADQIENWLNDEVAGGLAPSSIHGHYRVLSRVRQVAVEKERNLTNPCARVAPPRVPKREMVFLTWEQAVDLAEAHLQRYQALIYLAMDSGMRWSELVGLRRVKLDLRHGKVRVSSCAS